jgi:hypothetical protein
MIPRSMGRLSAETQQLDGHKELVKDGHSILLPQWQ